MPTKSRLAVSLSLPLAVLVCPAPVVSPAWSEDQPIHVWVTCVEADTAAACKDYIDSYEGPSKGSVAVHHNHSGNEKSGWETAIRSAESQYGITSVDATAMIRLGH